MKPNDELLTLDDAEIERREHAANEAMRLIREEKRRRETDAAVRRTMSLRPLVKRAHGVLCNWNHTDGCSWGYEEGNGRDGWGGWSHRHWLEHFDKLLRENGEGTRGMNGFTVELADIEAAVEAAENLVLAKRPMAVRLLRGGLTP